jgi:hypothetical protein
VDLADDARRRLPGPRKLTSGDRFSGDRDRRIDCRTLGPGTDRAAFDTPVRPGITCPRSVNVTEDADDAA